MSQLLQIIRYLDRDDISEIVIQTGRALTVRMAGEYRPLSKNPVSTPQIEGLLAGTPVEAMVPTDDSGGSTQRVTLADKVYQVRVARRGPALQVRIEADWKLEARGDSQVGPLPTEQSQVGPLPDRPSGLPERLSTVPAERPTGMTAPEPSAPPSGVPASAPSRGVGAAPATSTGRATTAGATPEALQRSAAQGPGQGRSSTAVQTPPAPVISTAPSRDAHRAVTRPVDVEALVQGGATPQHQPSAGSLARLVQQARGQRASDLHVAATRPVMIRVGGELRPLGEPLDAAAVERILLPLLGDAQRKQLEERSYVDFALDLGASGRVRANVSRQRLGLKGSFRLVLHPLPTLEELGLPAEIARVTTYHQGLVVIAGPNGHGKTTTLAAVIDLINASKPHHILTVEEPVEFLHPRKQALISQREVGPHTRSFATALKASLREDPDVIVIGELRDRETVEIALTAAETGHLVMVTMSTPSAAKTIDRLIDFFPPDEQPQVRASLAGALKFIVAQRLLPSASGDGFVAAVELLTGVPPLWALIRDNKLYQLPSLQQRGRSFGMIRLDDSLAELVRSGKVTAEAALAAAENRKELALTLKPAAPAPTPGAAPPGSPGAAQQAAAAANKGIQDLKSKVGGLFGKKE